MSASAPEASRARAGRSARAPATISTFRSDRKRARAGSRASTRTRCPRATSVAATWRPTKPVAPVTEISKGGSGRGAALVQEHQCAASPHDRGECVVHRRVEHRPREVGHALNGMVGIHLLLIGPRRAEGVVDLGGAEDAGGDTNGLAAKRVRVPAALAALVV